jgi:hypothetical protein
VLDVIARRASLLRKLCAQALRLGAPLQGRRTAISYMVRQPSVYFVVTMAGA